MKKCSVENCGKKYHARNFCHNHYLIWRYHNLPRQKRSYQRIGTKWSRRYGMSLRELAAGLGISMHTVYELAKNNLIPAWQYDPKYILSLTNSKTQDTVSTRPAETQTPEKSSGGSKQKELPWE
jgi:hypothetical protein